MRPLEIITSIILTIYIIAPLISKKYLKLIKLLPALSLVTIATHANIEGTRWQMIPLYVFSGMATLVSVPALMKSEQQTDSTTRPLRIILSLSLLAVSTALPILLPVPAIPAPSGEYSVGTRIYELTDESRKELYSGQDEARRFQIQVWYPSEKGTTEEYSPWVANANVFAPAYSEYLEFPSFFLDHISLARVPAYREANLVLQDVEFPVIIYSHGWNGFDAISTSQTTQLASHGYVVIGMQHTYGAIVTVFEDGTSAKNYPDALPDGVPDNEYEIAARKLVEQWSGDIKYALDFLSNENKNEGSPFYKALDLSQIGVYGHSTGGGAAIQFCGTDTRCKALLGQDPFMRPVSKDVRDRGVSQPSFFMFSQTWRDDFSSRNNRLFTPFYAKSNDTFGAVYIIGTEHLDFIDLPLLSPLAPQLGLKGPINGKRVTAIINDYLLSFFNFALKGIPTNLFENSNTYPEINTMTP
ncbi:MAG TPA: hypothetical protein VLA72_11075 [Anaerolineales bacterium]|nr:hypothetical protein [Anaerolineales bacterium]